MQFSELPNSLNLYYPALFHHPDIHTGANQTGEIINEGNEKLEIVEQTPARLVLQEKQSLLWRLVGIGSVVAAGIFWAVRILARDPSGEMLWPVLGVFGLTVVVGVGLWMFTVGDVSCTFDKEHNQVTVVQKGLLSLLQGGGVAKCRLHDISSVTLEEEWETDRSDKNSPSTYKVYRVALVLITGRHIPLTLYHTAELRKQQELANHIRKFLHTDYKRKIRRIEPRSS